MRIRILNIFGFLSIIVVTDDLRCSLLSPNWLIVELEVERRVDHQESQD